MFSALEKVLRENLTLFPMTVFFFCFLVNGIVWELIPRGFQEVFPS